jgi:hypothetical protein
MLNLIYSEKNTRFIEHHANILSKYISDESKALRFRTISYVQNFTGILLPLPICIQCFASITSNEDGAKLFIYKFPSKQPRIAYGVNKLQTCFRSIGYKVYTNPKSKPQIWIGTQQALNNSNTLSKKESFRLYKSAQTPLQVIGFDESGVLYGCLELAERIKQQKSSRKLWSIKTNPKWYFVVLV